MKTKLLGILLLVTLLATFVGSIAPLSPVSALGESQQIWYITDTLALSGNPSAGTGHTSISPPQAFQSSLTATEAITIPAGHWRGHISLNSTYTGSLTLNIGSGTGEINYVGSYDLPNATYQTGSQNGFNFDIEAGSMTIAEGDALYFKFNVASGTPDIAVGGIQSYLTSPPGSPSFPSPGQTSYGLTLSVIGNGATTPSASLTAYNYYANTIVPILAVPESGWNFTGWSGSITGTTNPTSITMNTTGAITANFINPVDLVLTTSAGTMVVGDTFDVVIQAQCGTQSIVGVDAYLDFDLTKLAVVDMNSGTAGIQITGGTTLSQIIRNSTNNTAGHIDFCAGVLGPEAYPTGTFTVATIRFQTLAQTSPTTTVAFSTSVDRPTFISGDIQGTQATGSLTSGVYTILSENDIDISVGLQGANRPDSAWLIPLTVKFFTPGSNVLTATPLYTFTSTSSKVGSTAVIPCADIQTGSYDISAVSSHTLVNVKRNVAIDTGTTGVSLGTLLEGNANNDGLINISDFGILSLAYGQLSTDLNYDPLADFDGNGVVNIADFSLLSGNYNRNSPIEIP